MMKLEECEMAINPFSTYPYRNDSSIFVGADNTRKDSIEKLKGWILDTSKQILLMRVRGFTSIGKTSTIKYASGLAGDGWRVYFEHDWQERDKFVDVDVMFKYLSDNLLTQGVNFRSKSSKRDNAIKLLRDQKTILVIGSDFFERNENGGREIANFLKEVNGCQSQSNVLKLIVEHSEMDFPDHGCIEKRMFDRCPTVKFPWSNVVIKALYDDEVKELILFKNDSDWRAYLEKADASMLVESIRKNAGRHPFLIQSICAALYDGFDNAFFNFNDPNSKLESFILPSLKRTFMKNNEWNEVFKKLCDLAREIESETYQTNKQKYQEDSGIFQSNDLPVELLRIGDKSMNSVFQMILGEILSVAKDKFTDAVKEITSPKELLVVTAIQVSLRQIRRDDQLIPEPDIHFIVKKLNNANMDDFTNEHSFKARISEYLKDSLSLVAQQDIENAKPYMDQVINTAWKAYHRLMAESAISNQEATRYLLVNVQRNPLENFTENQVDKLREIEKNITQSFKASASADESPLVKRKRENLLYDVGLTFNNYVVIVRDLANCEAAITHLKFSLTGAERVDDQKSVAELTEKINGQGNKKQSLIAQVEKEKAEYEKALERIAGFDKSNIRE